MIFVGKVDILDTFLMTLWISLLQLDCFFRFFIHKKHAVATFTTNNIDIIENSIILVKLFSDGTTISLSSDIYPSEVSSSEVSSDLTDETFPEVVETAVELSFGSDDLLSSDETEVPDDTDTLEDTEDTDEDEATSAVYPSGNTAVSRF